MAVLWFDAGCLWCELPLCCLWDTETVSGFNRKTLFPREGAGSARHSWRHESKRRRREREGMICSCSHFHSHRPAAVSLWNAFTSNSPNSKIISCFNTRRSKKTSNMRRKNVDDPTSRFISINAHQQCKHDCHRRIPLQGLMFAYDEFVACHCLITTMYRPIYVIIPMIKSSVWFAD